MAQVLRSQYALKPGIDNPWPGVAGLFQARPARFCTMHPGPLRARSSRAAQVTLILASALLFFVSRTPSSDSNYGGYGAF